MKKKLAKITQAKTEWKDRSIFNFRIFVDYEEFGSQMIGGIGLDNYSEKHERRIGTAYGCEMLMQVLKVLDVNDLSEAEGKLIYIIGEGENLSFKPKGIEQLKLNGGKSVIFEEIAKDFIEI
jgi:hypothetical protein